MFPQCPLGLGFGEVPRCLLPFPLHLSPCPQERERERERLTGLPRPPPLFMANMLTSASKEKTHCSSPRQCDNKHGSRLSWRAPPFPLAPYTTTATPSGIAAALRWQPARGYTQEPQPELLWLRSSGPSERLRRALTLAAGISSKRSIYLATGESSAARRCRRLPTGVHTSRPRVSAAADPGTPLLQQAVSPG